MQNQNDLTSFNTNSISLSLFTSVLNTESSSWSPFSTPAFSPYDVSSAIFQYSSQNESMPVSKLTSNENALKDISSRLNQPSSHSIEAKSNNKSLPIRSENIDMTDFIRQAAIQRAFGGRAKMCTFCKSNGECQQIYTSHTLKDSNDKITCPILLKYACPICGATGEQTHTKKYCPVLQKKLKLQMINKMTISSK